MISKRKIQKRSKRQCTHDRTIFNTTTFTIEAPPDTIFSLSEWALDQPKENITLLEDHGNGDAIVTTIKDFTVYLKPQPNPGHATTINVAVIDCSDPEVKSVIEETLLSHLTVLNEGYIHSQIKSVAIPIREVAQCLEHATTATQDTQTIFEYTHQHMTHSRKNTPSISGVVKTALKRGRTIRMNLDKANNFHKTLLQTLEENNIRKKALPSQIAYFGRSIGTTPQLLKNEVKVISPEDPREDRITQILDYTEELNTTLQKEHTGLKEVLHKHAPAKTEQLNNYD